MITSIIDEFQFSLPLDNELLITDVKNGVAITEKEIVEVAINARSLFVVSTLACRELEKVRDCLNLWLETRDLLAGLMAAWSQVEANEYPRVAWLLTELTRLRALCDDRVELYKISPAERIAYTEKRKDVDFEDSFSQRHALEPKGEHEPTSSAAHIYSLGHL